MEWVKCSDRMPNSDINESVLTFEFLININEKKPFICLEDSCSLYYDEEKKVAYSDGGGENITHWMPLPNFPGVIDK